MAVAEAGYRQAIQQATDALRDLLVFSARKCADPNYRHGISVARTRIEHLTPERGLYEEEKPDLATDLFRYLTSDGPGYGYVVTNEDMQERIRSFLKRRGIEG